MAAPRPARPSLFDGPAGLALIVMGLGLAATAACRPSGAGDPARRLEIAVVVSENQYGGASIETAY
jgi:hypothetical protein